MRRGKLRQTKPKKRAPKKPLTEEQKKQMIRILGRLSEVIKFQGRQRNRLDARIFQQDFSQELRLNIMNNIRRLMEKYPTIGVEALQRMIEANLPNLVIQTQRTAGAYRRSGTPRIAIRDVWKSIPYPKEDEVIEQELQRDAIVKSVRRLSHNARNADIFVQYMYGASINDIARQYELTRDAVEVVIRNIKKQLRADPEFIRKFHE